MKKNTGAVHCGAEVAGTAFPQWKKAILASAAALVAMGVSLDAQALALGAITVRSALGEPLRAEIEVPQISSEEASSFKANLASPQAFRAAGVEYTPALAGARLTLERRPNGQAYLRLLSERPINEPLLGIVIEANWATGRMVRDYTMLVDPPGRAAAPAAPEPQIQPGIEPARPAPARPVVRPPVAEQTTPSTASRTAQRRRPAEAAQPRAASGSAEQVVVQRGDTAYRIASANLPDGVSLDQMLMAMLRANPNAFIRNNVNLMKAGAVLEMPSAEQAGAMSRTAAHRAVVAHSRDFQSYRRGLAQNTPQTQVEAAGRSASGRVAARVQEGPSAPPSPDRLTLSKGAANAASAPGASEAGVSQSRQAQEQGDRIAELNRNISELSRLQGAPGTAASAATGSAAGIAASPAPSIDVPAGATPAASAGATAATAATAAASAATSVASASAAAASSAETAASAAKDAASATAAAASAAKPKAAPRVAKPAPIPEPEPSFLDSLTENPLLPVAGVGLLALLAGYGLYRSRQKKKAEGLDSSLAENPAGDSFFGASGGQHVDTNDRGSRHGNQSSMIYSPSQIDAAGDVDPVAEADVYLAYGRDMQAEEILKEALRTHPGRISVHRKLAEIYAKRRDARALEAVASEARTITNGAGPDWSHIRDLGKSLDPANALYATEGVFSADKPGTVAHGFGPDTAPMPTRALDERGLPSELASLDLDLEHALVKASPAKAASPVAGPAPSPSTAAAAAAAGVLGGAIGAIGAAAAAPQTPRPPAPEPVAVLPPDMPSLDFDLDADHRAPAVPPATSAAGPAPAPLEVTDSGMIDFDLEALSVDPTLRSSDRNTKQPDDADDDPLSTKLALAQEFHAIGDTEGALSLIKEVVAEATGPLKARAERFLSELS